MRLGGGPVRILPPRENGEPDVTLSTRELSRPCTGATRPTA